MKKHLSILLAISMLTSLLVMPAYAEPTQAPPDELAYVEGGTRADQALGSSSLSLRGDRVGVVDDDVKKGYIKVPLDASVAAAEKIELSLTAVSGNQTVSVYGVDLGRENFATSTSNYANVQDWSEDIITWSSAIGNDRFGNGVVASAVYGSAPLGQMTVNGAGEHKVDVTEYIKEVWNTQKPDGATTDNPPYATFILIGDGTGTEVEFKNVETEGGFQYLEPPILDEDYNSYDFPNATPLGQIHAKAYIGNDYGKAVTGFAYTGGSGSQWRTAEADSTQVYGGTGNAIRVAQDGKNARVRFYNALVSNENPETGLKNSDIGRKFEVSFMAMTTGSGSTEYRTGFMPVNASSAKWNTGGIIINGVTNSSGNILFTPGLNTWNEIKFTFEINDKMIATASDYADPTLTTLAVDVTHSSSTSVKAAFIDNLLIREYTESPVITAPTSPKLKLDDTTDVFALDASYVMPNDNRRKTFGGETIKVYGGDAVTETTDGTGKVYARFKIAEYEENERVELEFTLAKAVDQIVNIYALTDKEWDDDSLKWSDTLTDSGAQLVASIPVSEAGKYRVNVADYVASAGSTDITFILASGKKYKAVYDEDFDSGFETFTANYDYRASGNGSPSAEIKDGKFVFNRANKGDTNTRLKLFNLFANAPFGAEDVGRKFNVSLDIDADTFSGTPEEMGIRTSIMARYHGKTVEVVGTNITQSVPASPPTAFSFEWSFLQSHLDEGSNPSSLAFDGGSSMPVWAKNIKIDNILVEEISEHFGLAIPLSSVSLHKKVPAPFELISGQVDGSIAVGGTFTVKQMIENNTLSNQDAVMVIAVYDGDGQLIDLAVGNSTSLSNAMHTEISATLTGLSSEYDGGSVIKVFIWESIENPRPLLPAIPSLTEYIAEET